MNQVIVSNVEHGGEILETFIDSHLACLCWGIIGLVAFVFLLKYLGPLIEMWIKNKHERKMKDKAFKIEQYWFQQNNVERTLQAELEKKIEEKENEIKQAVEKQSKDEIEKKISQFELEWYKKILKEVSNLKCDINRSDIKNQKE
ncbi:MAG: hypothetical protein ACTTKO_07365 [Candidatus Limimorpha sp.]